MKKKRWSGSKVSEEKKQKSDRWSRFAASINDKMNLWHIRKVNETIRLTLLSLSGFSISFRFALYNNLEDHPFVIYSIFRKSTPQCAKPVSNRATLSTQFISMNYQEKKKQIRSRCTLPFFPFTIFNDFFFFLLAHWREKN